MKNKLPEIIVFAGPNGSGKTTITRMAKTIGTYINADDIKKSNSCTDLEATLNSDIPFRILKKKQILSLRKQPLELLKYWNTLIKLN